MVAPQNVFANPDPVPNGNQAEGVIHAVIEKRIAAVLQDLATYKRMSLSNLLEETFLHTFEPLGDGVASPHTLSQLRYIQELKRKHGIDYDCHASYRFVER